LKVVTIIGARPQFIKAAVVSRALHATGLEELLIHTGQHYDDNMSKVFFVELEIPAPVINLEIGSSTHGAQTGRMLEAIETALLAHRPDMVLVYGDTNSTLAGALAAVKLEIPVAHVEAGLRSFNRRIPEEINRVLTDHASDLLFAPSKFAVKNLLYEGIDQAKIHVVGDVMYDAALIYGARAETCSHILQTYGLECKKYALATVHRPENTDDAKRLQSLFLALMELSANIPIVLPLHPRTKLALLNGKMFEKVARAIQLIEPVGYLDMLMLEKNARVVVTDSGGVQKEAFFYRVPCVTVRDQTEWVELVEQGWNKVISPTNSSRVVETVQLAMELAAQPWDCPYGDGHAANEIVKRLCARAASIEETPATIAR
jgi:UDP-GlcNAc3NAcA epimerase